MSYDGVSGMIRCALWLEMQIGLGILGIGRGALDRKDSCTLQASGRHLAYWVVLDGTFVFLSAQVLDACDPSEQLMSIGDTKEGWETIGKVIGALERHNIKSLKRPIEAGTGPNGYVIDY